MSNTCLKQLIIMMFILAENIHCNLVLKIVYTLRLLLPFSQPLKLVDKQTRLLERRAL